MSQQINDPSQTTDADSNPDNSYQHEDVERYYQANLDIENNRHYIEKTRDQITELEQSESVEMFQRQVALLQKRLLSDPKIFQQMFITEGTSAIAWEFQQNKLSKKFTRTFWEHYKGFGKKCAMELLNAGGRSLMAQIKESSL